MTEDKKVIVLARHGKVKKNILIPEAKKQAYNIGANLREKYFKESSMKRNSCFVHHSGQQRAIDTGKSILAGIFGSYTRDYQQLERGKIWMGDDMMRSFLLGYEDIEYNEEALYGEDKEGVYMKIWTANPDSRDFEGQYVTCYNEMLRRGKACLGNTINVLIKYPYSLGMLITHLSIVEPIFTAGINSAKKAPATLEDIGGIFKTGEHAELVFGKDKQGTYSHGEFIRREKSYDVDLTNLLKVCEE